MSSVVPVDGPGLVPPPARPEPERDGHGRYKIPDPVTGEARTWIRATTWAKTVSDLFALNNWEKRMVAVGLAQRPDLLLRVAAVADPSSGPGKSQLDRLVEQAREHAKAGARANLGTALHAFTEACDLGRPLPQIPPPFDRDIAAYRAAMAAVEVSRNYVEQVCVVRDLGVAGTMDRVVRLKHNPLPMVGDVKGLALTTLLPTPDGWTTMGDVAVGDQVFDAFGRACRVIVKSQPKRIGTYVVRFDDGAEIVCDREHIWWTCAGPDYRAAPTPKSVEQVAATLLYSGQKTHRVPVAGALQLPDADLPIDPYVLGCWLGDGAVRGGTITKGADLFEVIAADGHQLGVVQSDARKPAVVTRTVLGLTTSLGPAGLLRNKHIPDAYLRASYNQRLRLLQGLLDTDGSWNTARNRACFYSTSHRLAFQVRELLYTLGQRPHLAAVPTVGFGRRVIAYHVDFMPVDLNPFRLPRKAQKAAANTARTSHSRRRVIVSVEPGPDVPTACIGVDSPSHTYLCGERMIPTHNTGTDLTRSWNEIVVQLALYAHADTIYDPVGRQHHRMIEVNQERALVIHLPAGEGRCTLYLVDIAAGWEMAQLCGVVRDWRGRRDLAQVLVAEDVAGGAAEETV